MIKTNFFTVNQSMESLRELMLLQIPHEVNYCLFSIVKKLEKANEYFITKYQQISDKEIDEEKKAQKIDELARTAITINAEPFDRKTLMDALSGYTYKMNALAKIDFLLTPDDEEEAFTIEEVEDNA